MTIHLIKWSSKIPRLLFGFGLGSSLTTHQLNRIHDRSYPYPSCIWGRFWQYHIFLVWLGIPHTTYSVGIQPQISGQVCPTLISRPRQGHIEPISNACIRMNSIAPALYLNPASSSIISRVDCVAHPFFGKEHGLNQTWRPLCNFRQCGFIVTYRTDSVRWRRDVVLCWKMTS